MFQTIPLVFHGIYGFNSAMTGLVFVAVVAGAFIGFGISSVFELYVQARLPDKGPENRLYLSCVLAPLVPAGMFWLGWTADADGPWILPALAVGCSSVGIFSTYLAVFNYLADAYHRYASSALAAQSFCRNIMAGILCLITEIMFNGMGVHGLSALLGGVSLALCAIPLVLMWCGPAVRARSVFASQLVE